MATARELVTYMEVKANVEELDKANEKIDDTKRKTREQREEEKQRAQEEKQRLKEEEKVQRDLEQLENKRYKALRNHFLVMSATMGLMTKEAVKFEYALKDIEKVNPHINLQKAEKTIMNMSKYASGKSLTDLSVAYKTFAQTLRDQNDIEGMMKLTEKGSIAYDMSAAETATALSIIRNNLKYSNSDIERLGDKVAYSHHQYGNALVPDIFGALQDLSGVMLNTGINEDFATTYATTLLNAGFEQSEVGRSFSRLMQRLSMGEYWEGREAFQQAGRDAGIDMVKLADDLVKGQKNGNVNEVMIEFFRKMAIAQAEGKKTQAIWGLLGGNNYSRQFQVIGALFENNFLDLYNKLHGGVTKANGEPIYKGEQERAYQIIMQTTEKQFQQLGNAMQRLSVSLTSGGLPALNASLRGLTKGINLITDGDFGGTIGRSFMLYVTATGGVFLLGFAKRHAALLASAFLPLGGLWTAIVALTPIALKIAELLGDKFAEKSPEEKQEAIKTDMWMNSRFNNATPVDLNHLSLEDVESGTKNAEMSLGAGLFSEKYRAQRGGYTGIDAGGTHINHGGMSLIQNINVSAEYQQLQSEIDARRVNDDLVNKIIEKSRGGVTNFAAGQFDKLESDILVNS